MTFAGIKRQVAVGRKILCVENTYRPELTGQMRTVTRVQTNGFWWKWNGDERENWTAYAPAKATTVLDDVTWKFSLGRGNDSVTLKLIEEAT